jgi:aminopeptidase
MSDPRTERLATVLVQYSAALRPGDRVLIEAETAAEALVRALFERALQAGAHPHLALSLAGQDTYSGIDDAFLRLASDEQLDYPPTFYETAYREFESRIRIYSSSNTNLMHADPARMGQSPASIVAATQMGGGRRVLGDDNFPTIGHATTPTCPGRIRGLRLRRLPVGGDDPVAYWKR